MRKQNVPRASTAFSQPPDSFSFRIDAVTAGTRRKGAAVPTPLQASLVKRPVSKVKGTYIIVLGVVLMMVLAMRPQPGTLSNQPGLLRRKRPNMIPQPGEYAPLRKDPLKESPLETLKKAPTRDYHFFIMGDESPILLNIVMGLLDKAEEHVAFVQYNELMQDYVTTLKNEQAPNNVSIVSKTNENEASPLERGFRLQYDRMYFIALSGKDTTVRDCAAPLENMLCLTQEELFYEDKDGQTEVLMGIVEKIRKTFPYFSKVDFDQNKAIYRVQSMETIVAQMKDVPATTFETKYGVHGAS